MQSLIISINQAEDEHIYTKISELCLDLDCDIKYGFGKNLQGTNLGYFLVCGNWNNIAKLETQINKLNVNDKTKIIATRANELGEDSKLTEPTAQIEKLPYLVQVITANKPGLVFNVCNFFSARQITLSNYEIETYTSSLNQTKMLAISFAIGISTTINISQLREEFLIYCEDLNVDGILEPDKR